MKNIINKVLATILICSFFLLWKIGVSQADTYVDGYYRSNGTYVAPHYRTDKNSTVYDNWSTYPNINPYTGKKGYRHR